MNAAWVVGLVAWSRLAHATDPPPSTAAVTQVAVVAGSTCALHADGNVSCWGRDLDRSVKNPELHPKPIGVPAFHDVVQLAGVLSGICARHRDGTVECLGMSASSTAVPAAQPLKDIVDLRGSCARTGDGHVSCFDSKTWSQIPHLDDAIDAYGGVVTGCAIHKDTTVSCWSSEPTMHPELVGAAADGSLRTVQGVKGAVQVSAGAYFGCARLRDGRVTCWGANTSGELGRGTVDKDDGYVFNLAAPVPGVTDAIDLLAGWRHACIRRRAGPMACWGAFPWSQSMYPRVTAVKPLGHVTAFAGGDQHCAVGKGRDVWCLGTDSEGELGNGLSGIQEVALEIPDVRDAIQIFATTLRTCAVHRTGAVTCWGDHASSVKLPAIRHLSESSRAFSGQYLTGLDAKGSLWISGEVKPRKLPKGTTHSGPCVIANDGEVWCNAYSSMHGSHEPVAGQLSGVTDAVEIVGSQRMVVRHRSGAVSTFHVDDALHGSAAATLPTIDDAIAIASGSRVACAVRADHSVWCWGDADSFLLGHPSPKLMFSNTQLPPARIAGIADAVSLAISDEVRSDSIGFICAVKVDGSVACWGENRRGQLGNGTRVASKTPVTIRGVHDAIQVVAGSLHACALESSGTIACWGSTEEGAGGTPATARIDHPVAVVWP